MPVLQETPLPPPQTHLAPAHAPNMLADDIVEQHGADCTKIGQLYARVAGSLSLPVHHQIKPYIDRSEST